MKKERIFASGALLLCVLAFASLGFDMFYAYLEDAAAFGEHIAKGFNLPEFSSLGFVPILMPIILAALTLSHLPYNTKIISLGILTLFNAISFNHALIALHGEMIGPVKWIVHLSLGVPIYMIAITFAEIAVFAVINMMRRHERK